MSILLNAPRSALRKPFQIVDNQAAGPPLWAFNFVTDTPGTDGILSGVLVNGMGVWTKFAAILVTDEVRSFKKMCDDSSVPWDDDYLGAIITYVRDAGFFYCVGSEYDYVTNATPATSMADDVSCPHIVAADYRTAPLTVGRVFQS